jgi:hypothetical protein
VPPAIPAKMPRVDFAARLKQMYGYKVMEVSGAELLAQERDRYLIRYADTSFLASLVIP